MAKPSNPSSTNQPVRLQVFLSRNGVCSRRKAFELVQSGAVTVNGQVVCEPSTPVDPHKDAICVRGQRVETQKYAYILFNKPAGCVTTKTDRFKEKTVYDYLPKEYHHLLPVGRLDKNTEGLLIFTNDGDLAYALTHPKFNVDKTYYVHVRGRLDRDKTERLENGVMVEGKRTAPASVRKVKVFKDRTEFYITIHEGRKRQVRLMSEAVGHQVIYLCRVEQGPIKLGTLKAGAIRPLTTDEISSLRSLCR